MNTLFRIIRFQLPYEDFLKKAEEGYNRTCVETIQSHCELGSRRTAAGEMVFETEPMSTTSAKFFIIEQCLRSMYGDPPHLIVNMTGKYKLLRTRAPQCYDYGYVIEIGTMPGEFGEERLLAIPKESVEYQSGRYSSGMYTPIDCS